jgi:hypothetical protein
VESDSSETREVPVVLVLNETEARKVLLADAVETVGSDLLPPDGTDDVSLQHPIANDQIGRLILGRANTILERLPRAYRRLTVQLPWPWLRTILPICAFVVGVFSNVLGPQGHIHAIVNPMMGLIAWNVIVVAIFAMLRRRTAPAHRAIANARQHDADRAAVPRERKPDTDDLEMPFLAKVLIVPFLKLWAGLVDLFEPIAHRISRTTIHVRVGGIYLSQYLRVCSHPITERIHYLLSLSAIVLAIGTITGMYLRAIVWDYTVVWHSTLIESPDMRLTIARLLFWPAALLFGQHFPSAQTMAEMATDRGAAGAVWIHVYAISALVYIVIPRSVLVYLAASGARASSNAVSVPVESMLRRINESILTREPTEEQGATESSETRKQYAWQRHVALEHFSLDVNATSVLSSLQAALIERDIKNTKTRRYFGDTVAFKRDWYHRWRSTVLAGFAASPDTRLATLHPAGSDALRSGIAHLAQSTNAFAPQLVALELAAFEAYWPLEGESKGSKLRRAFTRRAVIDNTVRREFDADTSHHLGLPLGFISVLRDELNSVNRSVSRFWWKLAIATGVGTALGALTFGIAAPFIGGLIGHAMGLAGAAAVNAGLAALGGGAVAAGGLGIAGGQVVIVGGGALLGIGLGSLGVMMNPASVLIQAVKIEVFLRTIVVRHPNAADVVEAVLRQLHESIERMTEEAKAARLHPKAATGQIADREKIIDILDSCFERCSAWAAEQKLVRSTGTGSGPSQSRVDGGTWRAIGGILVGRARRHSRPVR